MDNHTACELVSVLAEFRDGFGVMMPTERERRRYAVLHAAAFIYSNSLIKPFDISQHPEPHYWETFSTAVDTALQLLLEIERRELVRYAEEIAAETHR